MPSINIQEEDRKELLLQIHLTFVYRRIMALVLFLGFIAVYYFLDISLGRFLVMTSLLFLWFFSTFFAESVVKEKTSKTWTENAYFAYFLFEFFLFISITHFIGGIVWVGPFFAIIGLVFAYIYLSRPKAFFVTFFAIFLVSILVILEYKSVIPHLSVFDFGLFNDVYYVLFTFVVFWSFTIAVGFNLSVFSDILRKRNNDLIEAHNRTQDIKNSLKIRVRARREELKELTAKLDKEVKKKSKDLEEKISILEEINKETIKRELKMIELKKEIKKLKEELRKKKA